MKIKALVIGVVSALSLTASLAHADTTTTVVNGGTIHFKGEVVAAACAVDAGSVDQTVQMGQVTASSLATTGSVSSPVGFNIQLDGCTLTDGGPTTASINFMGTEATKGTNSFDNVLALQSSSAGSASQVGIQILDKTGQPVTLNTTSDLAKYALATGTNTLAFQARYYALDKAGAGTANADATFQIVYE